MMESNPDWGSKRDTNSNQVRWFGWKIHAAVDTKSELPVAVNVTPASVNDGIMAIRLVEDIKQRYSDIIHPKYYMMDMRYDFDNIYRIIHDQYNAQTIIPINRRGAYAPPEGLDWDCAPCVLWDIEWSIGAMIMVQSNSAVFIRQVRLTVQWALTGVHPATMELWLRKRYLINQDILLIRVEDQPNGRNYIMSVPLLLSYIALVVGTIAVIYLTKVREQLE